jgi:colanic acid/amylovoran/stewartan biosynthesis glycosyltransferase WcaL/AmsK/CpsK
VADLRGVEGYSASAETRHGSVAHVVPEYLPRSATFIYTLLRLQRQFSPVVLTRRTANLDEFPLPAVCEFDGARSRFHRSVDRIGARTRGYAEPYERFIRKTASEHRCRLIHAHFGWSGVSAVTAARRLGVPIVTTFYGRDLSERERSRKWWKNPYAQLFAAGDFFLCEGPLMAEYLQEAGCESRKIRLARIGLDLSQFPYDPPVRDRRIVFVQAARFVEKKGIDLSIRAFAEVRRHVPESELWIVGDGPLRPQLEDLISRLQIRDSVRLAGLVSHAEYRKLLRGVHICVQPSRTAADGDTEGGAPVVLLEMQAAGVPVVATRHADIPFVVAHQDQLVQEEDVISLAEALMRLVALPDSEWRERTAAARGFVETHHDARAIARQVEGLYVDAGAIASKP